MCTLVFFGFHSLSSEEPPRNLSHACSHCRTGVVLRLVLPGLVGLAAEVAVACCDLPPASSSLCRCCSLPVPPLPESHTTQALPFPLLLPSVCSGSGEVGTFSHLLQSTALARPLPPATRHRIKGTTVPPVHAAKYIKSDRLWEKAPRCQCHKCCRYSAASSLSAEAYILL